MKVSINANIKVKALDKLFDVVSKGIGVIYEPTRIKREATAESFKIIELAKANKLAEHAVKELDEAFYERMEGRMLVREINKQVNIEQISQKATEILKLEDSVSNEPVDEDWINRFFRYAEDIGREDMQLLWAKILAGEVKQPNSFSLRTLEFLKNVTKKDADLLIRFFNLVFTRHNSSACYIFDEKSDYLKKYDIYFNNVSYLREIGILRSEILLETYLQPDEKHYFFNKNTVLIADKLTAKINLPVLLFTTVGNELYKIADVDSNIDILKDAGRFIKKCGAEVVYTNCTMNGDIVEYNERELIKI